ncbi:PIG-L deacetylase family protein [Aquabacterium sp. J223]|uniref:PIG-L deacetylase family protein n=1 Tax=Aquabacterium sp. J223 TaxID=2898431 RepID=UPI0021ADA1DA|nr:PIG-L family deacetylase [Aquabacterium sp. J223]UUX95066.1 PIG-L family deacetylase [Aquabacterium sp. J223]
MSPLLLSPHLDDAVFACGEWLLDHPGTPVVTVFAGVPDAPGPPTDWDRRCGFDDAADAMAQRREEDRRALVVLGARPCWLPFLDSQYGHTPTTTAVAEALVTLAAEFGADTLVLPMGLFHSDHRLLHHAALQVLARRPALRALAYEDVPYRAIRGLLQHRLAQLLRTGWTATPVKRTARPVSPLKAQALRCYASQLRAFGEGGLDDVQRPERLWRLEREATPLP